MTIVQHDDMIQAITVRVWTKTSAFCHSDQCRANQDQSTWSPGLVRGRWADR